LIRVDLSIIIPAFNESARIVSTLDSVVHFLSQRPWQWEVIVVDDGGTDGTARLVEDYSAKQSAVRLLRNDRNRGKGFSVRNGVCQATGAVIGFIDADDKTDIQAADSVMELLMGSDTDVENGGQADIVIGDRTLPESQIVVPRRGYREWGSKQFSRLLLRFVGLGEFPDTQCGFKFFRQRTARVLFAAQRTDGYMFDVEIILRARASQCRIKQVPVRWTDDADSRFNPVSGMIRNLKELVKIKRDLRQVTTS
jgi:dolichyl-phosphate beta-glucosyltransferase